MVGDFPGNHGQEKHGEITDDFLKRRGGEPSLSQEGAPLKQLLLVLAERLGQGQGTPFASDEKNPAIFPAESHRQAHDLLDSTASLRGVMLLTGAPGSGKSTLIKTWMRGLEPKRHLPLLITQSSLSASGVLEILLAKLGERPRFKRSASLIVLARLSRFAARNH